MIWGGKQPSSSSWLNTLVLCVLEKVQERFTIEMLLFFNFFNDFILIIDIIWVIFFYFFVKLATLM